MLCKSPENNKVENLWVIQLIKADLNMYFRFTWGEQLLRKLLHSNNGLPEQFRNHLDTLETSETLLNLLSFDLIWIFQLSATIFNNSAKVCDDQIFPFLYFYIAYNLVYQQRQLNLWFTFHKLQSIISNHVMRKVKTTTVIYNTKYLAFCREVALLLPFG